MASAEKWWACPTCGEMDSRVCSDAFHTCYCFACEVVQPIDERFGCPRDQLLLLMCGHAWSYTPSPPEPPEGVV